MKDQIYDFDLILPKAIYGIAFGQLLSF